MLKADLPTCLLYLRNLCNLRMVRLLVQEHARVQYFRALDGSQQPKKL